MIYASAVSAILRSAATYRTLYESHFSAGPHYVKNNLGAVPH